MNRLLFLVLGLYAMGFHAKAQTSGFSTTSTQSNPFAKIGITDETVVINGYDHIPQGDSIITLYGWGYNKHTSEVVAVQAETDIDSATQLFAGEKPYRWLSVDPVVHPYQSPFTGFDNNPIIFIDPDGRKVSFATLNEIASVVKDLNAIYKAKYKVESAFSIETRTKTEMVRVNPVSFLDPSTWFQTPVYEERTKTDYLLHTNKEFNWNTDDYTKAMYDLVNTDIEIRGEIVPDVDGSLLGGFAGGRVTVKNTFELSAKLSTYGEENTKGKFAFKHTLGGMTLHELIYHLHPQGKIEEKSINSNAAQGPNVMRYFYGLARGDVQHPHGDNYDHRWNKGELDTMSQKRNKEMSEQNNCKE